ncbi:MAG: hypothetical protein RLZZ241_1565 [Bacteroidota bacterium]|jgi:NTE family protein
MQKHLIVILCLLVVRLSYSQVSPANTDVKVGLVLSGGGAKGIAHIGALKVIESAGIRLDYIGGTSMGAIIGALYASGYSARQLDSIFTAADLEQLIQDNLPRNAKTFYEKEDSERYAISLPFSRFNISFPQAISGGQNIYNLLVQLLYHVRDIKDFSKLPIPFFCMATDVESGEEVLLNHGYLPEAIIASGTFPTVFEPAEIEGRMLVDGGVLNNYPVAELRAMGAELVIGVDVQHGLRSREELQSATEILMQINNYHTAGDMVQKAAATDIYIQPEIDQYSIMDFDARDSLLLKGEQAAFLKWKDLRQLASLQYPAANRHTEVSIPDSLEIDQLILEGNNTYTRGYVLGKLRLDLGKKVAFERLFQGISNLAATGNFNTIRYQIKTEPFGTNLQLRLQENPNRAYMRLAANYNDLYRSAALINLTRKHLLFNDDVASIDLILGDNLRYNAEYYLDKGFNWSFGFNSRFNQFNKSVGYTVLGSNFELPIDENINFLNVDIADWTNSIYLQTVLQDEFAFSIGLEHKFLEYSTKTISDGTLSDNVFSRVASSSRYVFEKSHYGSVFGEITLDTFDDKYFPTRGIFAEGRFNLYLISSDFSGTFKEFSIAKGSLGGAFTLGSKLSLNLQTEGGFKLGKSPVTTMDFMLGGVGGGLINNYVSFLGYDFLSLAGNSYVKSYARLDWEFYASNHLFFATNVANVADDLFRTGDWFALPTYTGIGLGYGRETFFGPLQITYTWSAEAPGSGLFINLGFWF